jgi:3,4-dihydroxy 2-butanone 4-phosphate synthase
LVRYRCYFANVGTTTGISAHDRALTARKLADPKETDGTVFTRPGHIFPLRYTEGGVLKRGGHTEASVGNSLARFRYFAYSSDLCKLAGLQPAAIICELVRDQDGLMARRDDCVAFAKKFGFKLVTIAALVEYLKRKQHPNGSS